MAEGRLVYFMGPSGAGKDSLLDALRQHWPAHPALHWARRTINRMAAAGGEAHDSVSTEEFTRLRDSGALALHWEANGLAYGVQHTELQPLAQGHWVLVNGSRAYWTTALARYPGMVAVHITAHPDVLRSRLLARGRETAEQIEQRVQRAMALEIPPHATTVQVHNDTTLEAATRQLVQQLRAQPGWPA